MWKQVYLVCLKCKCTLYLLTVFVFVFGIPLNQKKLERPKQKLKYLAQNMQECGMTFCTLYSLEDSRG